MNSASISERETVLYMRVCGKILKRELRKEDKRTKALANQHIYTLLEEEVHSAESGESSIDSVSVNYVKEDIQSDKEETTSAGVATKVTSSEIQSELPTTKQETPSPLVNLFCALFFVYMISIVVSDSLKS